jgi:hypothetical protein
MTPKEKALQLYDNIDNIYDLYIDIPDEESKIFIKECAILSVNQILEIASDYSEEKIVTKAYWKKVKKEIEKI